jgi:toxin FitB
MYLLDTNREQILTFDGDAAQLWGRLRVPHPENALDKRIAAIALVLVTRNIADFNGTGVRLTNPFAT